MLHYPNVESNQTHTFFYFLKKWTFDKLVVVGKARTGSGKTLAFALPIIQKLNPTGERATGYGRLPRVLVMAPTRELAKQTSDEFVRDSDINQ